MKDWFDNLSDEQQASVMRGLEQADKGETISHDETLVLLEIIDRDKQYEAGKSETYTLEQVIKHFNIKA